MISWRTTVTIVTVWVTAECTGLVFIFKRVVTVGGGGHPCPGTVPVPLCVMPLLLVHFS